MSIDDKEQSPIATDSVGENAIESKETEGLSQGKIVFRKFLRHKGAMVGLIVLFLVTVFAYSAQGIGPIPGWWIFNHTASGPIVNPGGAPTWTPQNIFSPGEHPFGQDEIGRDNFARVMKGTQISIMVMLIIGIVALIIGTIVGALAGYYRGWVDSILMRVTDGFIILPVIVVGAILGKLVSGTGGAMLGLVLGAILWTGLARLVRGDFLSCASANSSTPPESRARATSGSCSSTCFRTRWASSSSTRLC